MSQPIEDLPGQTYIPGTEPREPMGHNSPGPYDVKGRPFSPKLHKVRPDGQPVLKNGRLVMKTGFPAGKERKGPRGKAAKKTTAPDQQPAPKAPDWQELASDPDGESSLGEEANNENEDAESEVLPEEEVERHANGMARQLETAHQMAFGAEEGTWTPQERVGMTQVCAEYIRSRGVLKLPPEIALGTAVLAIVAARADRPRHKSLWQRITSWQKPKRSIG